MTLLEWFPVEGGGGDNMKLLEAFDYKKLKGKLEFLKDESLLDKIDQSRLQVPGIEVEEKFKYDKLKVKQIDRLTIKQNAFIQYSDPEVKKGALIIPVELT